MPGPAHVVVVDDEADIRDMVQEYLSRHGYAVSAVDGGASLRALLAEKPADVVLLDINMPNEDGLAIAKYLRSRGPVGIVMLTASRTTADRVNGLEIGADDYVTKPFDLRELLARVRSVLRRASANEPTATANTEMRFGRCIFDVRKAKLYSADGKEIAVTAMEFELLQAFARNPNRVLSRDQLLGLAGDGELDPFDRSIDTRIARLRKKIELSPDEPQSIRTVRGVGYIFVPGGA
ncbi:response regulator transcription factor [Mesorhizobium sp. LHD-90]|uniref:response regulator transcription factor n=1 Tax=Mesorhizobium sp. LHD-90 TaxID=3071414 RepID=UPI0027E1FB68|nr:response regulator transcription factor [Mesorhizobium sp. LHD-90]MDQ6433876.1 response regulator transcription factor [Mesorhizobium sp. LHD-90]